MVRATCRLPEPTIRGDNVFNTGEPTPARVGWTMEEHSITVAVVDAVAQDKGMKPTDLPPLHGAIDPDALETVVATGATNCATFYVEFEFTDRLVTLDGTEVSVRPLREGGNG